MKTFTYLWASGDLISCQILRHVLSNNVLAQLHPHELGQSGIHGQRPANRVRQIRRGCVSGGGSGGVSGGGRGHGLPEGHGLGLELYEEKLNM